jgi:hypothetical protein
VVPAERPSIGQVVPAGIVFVQRLKGNGFSFLGAADAEITI